MKSRTKEKKEERKLTEAEERRKKIFEAKREQLIAEGYHETDLTIGVVYANVMAVVFGLPIVLLLGWVLVKVQSPEILMPGRSGMAGSFAVLAAFIVGIVAHELIHGAVWAAYAKEHFKSIEFGFIKEYLTPYCCCVEPLRKAHYIMGALMPTILLGIVPCVFAIVFGSVGLFSFGCLMIFGGGGDMTMVWVLLRHRCNGAEMLCIDHPYDCGTIVFER